MFEEIKEKFYESLVESIKDRKKSLKLIRDDILPDPKRVSKILNITRDAHYPHLIGKGEYPRLIYLFLCKDYDSFNNEHVATTKAEILKEKCGNNYDKMLWGHIDWDKMFRDVITELSESNSSEDPGKSFEDTLDDYVPYAVIKYENLHAEYAKVYIPQDEKEKKRQDAIKWVHLRHGSGLFKQTFYEKFSGKTLREFDNEFNEFLLYYLEQRKPNQYSLGLQAYNIHKNLSGFASYWQSLAGVQYGDMSDEEAGLETLLREYINNGREQMKELEKYQQKFDALHIDIK